MNHTLTSPATPTDAISRLPGGRWAVGVSGGADSVALLMLLRDRALAAGDLHLQVVHIDHETRAGESTIDAAFVRELAARWQLGYSHATLTEIESSANLPTPLPNVSARYRAARQRFFRDVIEKETLQGVILAHHADDQAETILHRLTRGAGFSGLCGMKPLATVCGLLIARPLLSVPSAALRALLHVRNIAWREDSSNASVKYRRNQLRRVLVRHADLSTRLRELGDACAALKRWADDNAPLLPPRFPTRLLADLPDILAAHAARRWLAERGSPAEEITPATVNRLLLMARDAASPARGHFPGTLLVRRRAGEIWVEAP